MNVAKPAIQTFGKYQILERIATGGMAEIYKARLEGIGGFLRSFAIKRILPNLSQNSEHIAMLVDEAKVAGLLSHANIVQILDLGQVDGIWYIAMEYVHGRDLGGVLRRARKKGLCLPVPHTVFVAIELLKGLEYAHQRQVMRGGRPVALNIIHRDVSPPNVLLSFQGEVKLTDFGIARASLKAMETVSGIVKGRFDYMSPEQAAGSKDLDQRSDLFSVGVVLYEMLTGHHPFRTDNEIGTIERVRTGKYVPVSQRNPEVPFTLETIVDRALQVNREDRYPSATAFKEALDKFFHDAGFIFTHATLASYVRGLFPEANSKPGRTAIPESTTSRSRRPPADSVNTTGGHSVDIEGPTKRLDKRRLSELRPPGDQSAVHQTPTTLPGRDNPTTTSGLRVGDTESTAIRPSPLEDFLNDADQETLIKKMPDGWEDEVSTQLRPQPWSDEEQETVIRRPPPEYDDEHVTTHSGSLSSPGRRTSTGSRPRRSSGRSGMSLLGWAMSVMTLFFGLGAGALLMGVVLLLAGFRPVTADPELRSPVIKVVAPAGTQVQVDGEATSKEIEVTPQASHTVEVTLEGHEPWRTELKMNHGETRVIIVTSAQAEPVEAMAEKKKKGR